MHIDKERLCCTVFMFFVGVSLTGFVVMGGNMIKETRQYATGFIYEQTTLGHYIW